MKILFLSFLSIIILSASTCSNKVTDFENVVEITPADAQKWDLPDVHFKFSYPTDDNIKVRFAEEGAKNYSYAYVDYMTKNKLSIEEISIGYCKKCATYGKDNVKDLLKSLADQFEYQLPNFNLISNDIEEFDGEERNLVKFTFSTTDGSLGFEEGDYIGVFVVYNPDDGDNGILYILLANTDKTDIKDFDDFTKKGNLVDIFKTIRFVD